jgi:hypothetical protein
LTIPRFYLALPQCCLALTLHSQHTGCEQVVMENAALQNTAAPIEVKRTASGAMHDNVWKDYGGAVLESEFAISIILCAHKCLPNKFIGREWRHFEI